MATNYPIFDGSNPALLTSTNKLSVSAVTLVQQAYPNVSPFISSLQGVAQGGYFAGVLNQGEFMTFVVDFTGLTAANTGTLAAVYYNNGTGVAFNFQIDGGAWQAFNSTNTGTNSVGMPFATNLSAGKHHVRIVLAGAQYFSGIVVTGAGSSENIVSTQKTLAYTQSNLSGLGLPIAPSIINRSGMLRNYGDSFGTITNTPSATSQSYPSGVLQFSVANCTGLEMLCLVSTFASTSLRVSVNGSTFYNVKVGDSNISNNNSWIPIFGGMASGTKNVIIKIGFSDNINIIAFKAHNGSGITTTPYTQPGQNQVVIDGADVAKFANNDWVEIDNYPIREVAQITSGGGTGTLTLDRNLKYLHGYRAAVNNCRCSVVPVFSSYSGYAPPAKWGFCGDSTTEGTTYIPQSELLPFFSAKRAEVYDPDVSFCQVIADICNIQPLIIARQGFSTSNNLLDLGNGSDGKDSQRYLSGIARFIIFGGGAVNDLNSGTINDATTKANIIAIINGVNTVNPNIPIDVIKIMTPIGNVGLASKNQALTDAVNDRKAAGLNCNIYDCSRNMDLTAGGRHVLADGLHYQPAGYQLIALNYLAQALPAIITVGQLTNAQISNIAGRIKQGLIYSPGAADVALSNILTYDPTV